MGSRPSTYVAEAVPEILASDRPWSVQQQDIFDWFETGVEDEPRPALVVRARAGTGKTTTIIEGVNRAADEGAILLCAFNKRIAEELNTRITNPHAEAKTLHALGYAAIRLQWSYIRVAEGSTRADSLTSQVVLPQVPRPICRLVSLLHTKGREMVPTTATVGVLRELAFFFDYVPDESWEPQGYTVDYVATAALAAMERAATEEAPRATGIDFADMVYLPLVRHWLTPVYELVVVDEAQDMTLAQLEIAQRVCRGRFCVVGDDRQAIYAFRGADSGSLDRLKGKLQAEELPLTVTYRCGQSIVRRAQTLVPDIQAHPTNPEGCVDTCDYEHLLRLAQPGDFILSRLNAPLVSLTLHLLRAGKRARMAGRDVGKGIHTLITKLVTTGRLVTLEGLLGALDTWERKTVTQLASYGQSALIDRCRDQADMVRALAEEAISLADLNSTCLYLFTDDQDAGQILCSSVHKAKGLEANRVYILQESLYRRGASREEENIDYVATTRAKSHLTLVTSVPTLQYLQ